MVGMQKKKQHSVISLLLPLAFVFVLAGIILNYMLLSSVHVPVLSVTGRVVDTSSTVTLTQSGVAGILVNSTLSFGSGYYNASCTTGSSILESNKSYGAGLSAPAVSPGCWINTTGTLDATVYHSLVNNGSVVVNVSAYSNQQDAETFYCGSSGCPITSNAQVDLYSINAEANSCSATLTNGFETILFAGSNTTLGICDALDFSESSDTVHVYVRLTIPKDATSGSKSMVISYQALGL